MRRLLQWFGRVVATKPNSANRPRTFVRQLLDRVHQLEEINQQLRNEMALLQYRHTDYNWPRPRPERGMNRMRGLRPSS
jgi:hypothetical protein